MATKIHGDQSVIFSEVGVEAGLLQCEPALRGAVQE